MHQYDRTGLPSFKRVHANSELALPHLEAAPKLGLNRVQGDLLFGGSILQLLSYVVPDRSTEP